MSAAYSPDLLAKYQTTEAFSVVGRIGLDRAVLTTWDDELLREPRVCVPIDVQALVVSADDLAATAGVAMVGPLSPGAAPTADTAAGAAVTGPEPFADPAPREPGVHLHWAMPDALLTGRLADPGSSSSGQGPATGGGGLGLAPLPDRWLVLRLLAPVAGTVAVQTGWVLDAGSARAWPLAAWTGSPDAPGGDGVDSTAVVPPGGLTGTAGGTLTWSGGYDAALGRFAFHDPLTDLATDPQLAGTLPGGPEGGRATYLVVGWWSQPGLDPLDPVRGSNALDRRLAALAWRRKPLGPQSSPEPGPAARVSVPTEHAVFGRVALGDVGALAATRYGTGDPVTRLGVSTAAAFAPGLLGGGGYGRIDVRVDGPVRYLPPADPPRPHASTLLHGAVVGVPVLASGLAERLKAADLRPRVGAAETALGEHLFDAVGALTARSAAARLGVTGDADLAVVERLVTAFLQHALQQVSDPGGAAAIDADVHAEGFRSVAAAEAGGTDRVLDGQVPVPERGRRVGTVSSGRHSVLLVSAATRSAASVKLIALETAGETVARAANRSSTQTGSAPAPAAAGTPAAPPTGRTETRPAPSRYVPADPYLAVRGAGRSTRHGGDGAWSTDGTLLVRHPSQLVPSFGGSLPGSAVLGTVPSGAVPAEATTLAREAVLLSAHLTAWLARCAAARAGGGDGLTKAYQNRFAAEHLLRYDSSGAYSTFAGTSSVSAPLTDAVWRPGDTDAAAVRVVAALREHSMLEGTEPSPVGITAWAQPWAPTWLEYAVEVRSSGVSTGTNDDWSLGQTDLEPVPGHDPATTPVVLTFSSRVPLTTGTAASVGGAVSQYLRDEAERDVHGVGEIDDTMASRLALLAGVAGSPDLLGAALDGVRQRLLGLPARTVRAKGPDGAPVPLTPDALPHLLSAGAVRVTAARVVDAFGRVLDLEPATAAVPQRLTVTDLPGAVRRPPRFSAPARVVLRLVGATATSATDAVEARVDEVDATAAVNPVSGFLLPDHVDESFEVFATDGTALGELLAGGAAGPDGGGVVWEPAPGRPVPVDAAPSVGLAAAQGPLAAVAAGMVAADAHFRGGDRAVAGADSALSALLRAIDTTLWTVDPIAGAGSAELASIVGRPIAVVRAVLSVDVADDLDALTLDTGEGPSGRSARAAAYAALAQVEVRVRLGEITRPDDGLLAWFVDDDYSQVHLVDAAVADLAREAGPGRGHLVTYGQTPIEPAIDPITHPYVLAGSELVLRPGVPRLLTLLMAPGAGVHLTSGVVPRTRTALSRSWFAAGLDRLVPSVRVGPVLVDPGDVRLPLVAALGDRQVLTTREGPLGWRDDAILAAGSSALLPDRATVLREGWVRVNPLPPSAPGAGGGSS